jgi:hypothetical protein
MAYKEFVQQSDFDSRIIPRPRPPTPGTSGS